MQEMSRFEQWVKDRFDDRGATTVEWLMWAAVVVVAIAAIGVALRQLGIDVIDYIGSQIMG